MDSKAIPETTRGGQRRRRRSPLIALVVGLVLAGAVSSLTTTAAAVPPDCDDGGPPPCEPPPPPTDPPPPSAPPAPTWFARVHVLDQSRTTPSAPGFNRHLTGAWSRNSQPRYGSASGTVAWTNASQTVGSLGLASAHIPPGNGEPVGFWLRELGAEFLCRSHMYPNSAPPSGREVHVLTVPEVVTSAAQLQELAGGFVGDVTPTPAGANHVRIDTIDLVPEAGHLRLDITGYIDAEIPSWPNDIDDDFTYSAKLHPFPSNAVTPGHVVDFSTEPDYRFVLYGHGPNVEGPVGLKFRAAVEDIFEGAFDANVAARPETRWFASIGYTTSFRRVTVAADGIHVLPSLCKVD